MPTRRAQAQSLSPLPLRVRPHLGESTENYIRRLARANHLRPSTLHSVACGPPNWTGKPRLERLAVLTGRPAGHLERALIDGLVPRRRTTVTGRYANPPEGTYLLYRAIRRDAERGLSLRRLAERHGVSRCVVRRALTASLPLARQRTGPSRTAPVIDSVRHLVDPMISSGMRVADIWRALMDDHEVSISVTTLHAYIRSRRTGPSRTASVIDSVRHLVDPMISSGMSVRGIQSALRDDHEVSISVTTLHTYIRSQRTNSCPR
ncbi:hypothetical protein HLB32_04925 [Streptomyces cacaoi]|uniref:hypothetical protein n=1 Tax=Streptomyces cacaoi TaxID=1898 RepID=UPI0014786DE4|nr:hypothetical protein [Streptomyces cacaoi]NNG84274.1 hypothetical protein [Streptomyces cacaoi]